MCISRVPHSKTGSQLVNASCHNGVRVNILNSFLDTIENISIDQTIPVNATRDSFNARANNTSERNTLGFSLVTFNFLLRSDTLKLPAAEHYHRWQC